MPTLHRECYRTLCHPGCHNLVLGMSSLTLYIAQLVVVETTYSHLIRRRSFPVSLFGENTFLLFLPFYTQVQGSAELGDGFVVKKVWLDELHLCRLLLNQLSMHRSCTLLRLHVCLLWALRCSRFWTFKITALIWDFFFESLQSYFVLYTLTERKIKFSYNNRGVYWIPKGEGSYFKKD